MGFGVWGESDMIVELKKERRKNRFGVFILGLWIKVWIGVLKKT